MTTEVKNFSNPEFGNVRAMSIDNEPWFVGKDVAQVLGYKETAKAIREHVDTEDKGVSKMDTPGGSDVFNVLYAAAAMEVTRNHANIKKANSLIDYIKKFMEGLKNE